MSKIADIQTILGVAPDGIFGKRSQAALDKLILLTSARTVKASSFADPKDIAAFKRCKAQGKSDMACFKVGDNGIGQFGADTTSTTKPMVALHADDMKARWKTVKGAAHKPVKVHYNGKTITATVEDRMSAPGRIDLNPGAAKALGLKPPFLVSGVTWEWI